MAVRTDSPGQAEQDRRSSGGQQAEDASPGPGQTEGGQRAYRSAQDERTPDEQIRNGTAGKPRPMTGGAGQRLRSRTKIKIITIFQEK